MKKYYKIIVVVVLLTCTIQFAKAQLNPLSAQYFTNLYLANPAYAGLEKGLTVNATFRQLWNSIPGAPMIQNLTAEYSKSKTALGLNISYDKAGLQRQTRVVGTYAYHLPLSNSSNQLHFGVSFGFSNQRLATSDVEGNTNDPLIPAYNQRETYVDGDFGIAYTDDNLKLEAALPNLNSVFKQREIKLADYSTFYTAASYEFTINDGPRGFGINPKVAFRGVRGFGNIVDAGAQFTMANKQVMLTALYHSSKNATFGLGMKYLGKYLFNATYTTQTAGLSSYTNGSFEISLGGRF